MDPRKVILPGGLLLISAAALLQWYAEYTPSNLGGSTTANPVMPDIMISGIKQTTFNATGLLDHSIEAQSAIHFELQGVTKLEHPHITFYEDNNVDWRITANKGNTADKGETLHLAGNVIAIQADNNNLPLTTFETQQLVIHPKKEYAETVEPVIISQANNKTKAVGMTVDIQSGIMTLLSQVQSRHEPTP